MSGLISSSCWQQSLGAAKASLSAWSASAPSSLSLSQSEPSALSRSARAVRKPAALPLTSGRADAAPRARSTVPKPTQPDEQAELPAETRARPCHTTPATGSGRVQLASAAVTPSTVLLGSAPDNRESARPRAFVETELTRIDGEVAVSRVVTVRSSPAISRPKLLHAAAALAFHIIASLISWRVCPSRPIAGNPSSGAHVV